MILPIRKAITRRTEFRFPDVSRIRRCAFTLVELVVVLTILGLAASIVTFRFAGPLREARVRSALEQWRATDQFARQANRSGQLTIVIQHSQNRSLIAVKNKSDQIIRRWPIDAPLSIAISSFDGRSTDSLVFDTLSGCQDYRVTIRESTFVRVLDFAGGTGCVRSDKTK